MDSSEKKTVVAVVSDYKFLNSNFNKLYDQLRGHGNYQGEILVITSKFFDSSKRLFCSTQYVGITLSLASANLIIFCLIFFV